MDNYDHLENNEDTPWECFLCAREEGFDTAPYGWIADYHPLCKYCADTLLHDHNHISRYRLSYHYKTGEIKRNC